MGENSKIEWCDHTASPWHGCSKVSAGCDHCYAAAMAQRNPGVLGIWGDEGVRVKSKSFVRRLEQWDHEAEQAGKQVTVFPSLCDPFEDRPELGAWRNEMFAYVDRLLWVTLILVTKRPENIRRMWPEVSDLVFQWNMEEGNVPNNHLGIEGGVNHLTYRHNIWLLTSVENQEQADKRIPELLQCRDLVPVLGLSCEPLLGPVCLQPRIIDGRFENHHDINLDWVICGGESGPKARPMHPDWARSLRDQCAAAGVPFFFKQWGEWAPINQLVIPPNLLCNPYAHIADKSKPVKVGKSAAGRLLDGVEWSQFPEVV